MIARLTMTGLRGHGVLPFRRVPETELECGGSCQRLRIRRQPIERGSEGAQWLAAAVTA
jgi:hypothetical protein